MKAGFRSPSLKKSFKARTTGKYKRRLKKAVYGPFYAKKGLGLIKDPSRSIKNKIYHKTSWSVVGFFKGWNELSKSNRGIIIELWRYFKNRKKGRGE